MLGSIVKEPVIELLGYPSNDALMSYVAAFAGARFVPMTHSSAAMLRNLDLSTRPFIEMYLRLLWRISTTQRFPWSAALERPAECDQHPFIEFFCQCALTDRRPILIGR